MLIEFSVANYRSFREKVTLSMVASERDKTLPGNTFETGLRNPKRLLKSAAVYGANASGKTNLLRALGFVREMVVNSAQGGQQGQRIDVAPFKLDPECLDRPSEFEVMFAHQGERYTYGFSCDAERVCEEWLVAGRRLLFERAEDGSIEFGDSWRGEAKRLVPMLRPNALFLSVATQYNNPATGAAFEWFADSLLRVSDDPEAWELRQALASLVDNPATRGVVQAFLEAADVGVDRVEVVGALGLPPILLGSSPAERHQAALRNVALAGMANGSPVTMHGFTVRRSEQGQEVFLDLESEEAAGTRRLISLALEWGKALQGERTLVVDELQAHLHPALLRLLVQSVHAAGSSSQLVFVTHDACLLDLEALREDQVWFAEKRQDNSTELYSLVEFKRVRGLTNMQSGYLTGRFGAVPFVGEVELAAPQT